MSSGNHKENYKKIAFNWCAMPKNFIKIRTAEPKDAKSILKVHYDAVHKTASKDYSKEILHDWSPPVTNKRIEDYKKKSKGRVIVVAEINREIIGFGTIVPKECEIRAVYVSPKAKRKGAGTALLKKLEAIAKEKNIKKLNLESSITAEKFYNKNGYKSLRYGYFTLNTGRKMKSVNMIKKI